MATVCSPSQSVVAASLCSTFQTGSHSTRLKSIAALAVPNRQVQNGILKIIASSEERCSRREAMTLVGGAGLAGLLLLVPVGSAEAARTAKPGVRQKIREELEKVKEEAVKNTAVAKKKVEGAVKTVGNKVAKK